MRDRYQEFRGKNAEVVIIGMGTPKMAATFKARMKAPFPMLVDRELRSYKAVGLKKGSVGDVIGPRLWAKGTKILLRGRGMATPKQNPYQLGGVAVVARGGDVLYVHRARNASDFPSIDELLTAIE